MTAERFVSIRCAAWPMRNKICSHLILSQLGMQWPEAEDIYRRIPKSLKCLNWMSGEIWRSNTGKLGPMSHANQKMHSIFNDRGAVFSFERGEKNVNEIDTWNWDRRSANDRWGSDTTENIINLPHFIQGVRPGVCIERPGWCMLISIWPYDSMDWANKYRLS
jgi:hypothetical protein